MKFEPAQKQTYSVLAITTAKIFQNNYNGINKR